MMFFFIETLQKPINLYTVQYYIDKSLCLHLRDSIKLEHVNVPATALDTLKYCN